MNESGFYQQLCTILSKEQILCDEPMERHTSFRVGGPADYFLLPVIEQAADVIALCQREHMPYHIIGNGSNLLVSDAGIRGVVIAFTKNAARIQAEGSRLTAGAGALLSQAAAAALKASLGGLEFAAGIPGSVGGAVVMNAGAYGGELKDVLAHARVLGPDGKIQILDKEQLDLSYRHKKPQEEIKAYMDELKKRRIEKQPLEYPSAGSTFKRPQGYFAGKLIMDAGLAGFSVGGAQVSEKHCGFVINKGGAKAADILELIRQVQQKVRQQAGVELEMEVKRMGDFT